MTTREINFDGLIGPVHNYAGLSPGNIASATNAGAVSQPRAAALQGLAKMKRLMDRGLVQGFLPPPRRPATAALRALGYGGSDREVLAAAASDDPILFNNACSASAMWAANAATVIAAPDSGDGRVHLVTANLATMLHRSFEAPDSFRMLRTIFRDGDHFMVHPALPGTQHFSDEGAANHMRIAPEHGARGLNIFIHGAPRGSRFPERQARRAGEAVARLAGVDGFHMLQSQEAIEAGAFHNDVVAVANENVLLAHAHAFADRDALFAAAGRAVPGFVAVEVDSIGLDDAIGSYLFNSQLVTLPEAGMALVLPSECRDNPRVWTAVEAILAANNPINEAIVVDVRESMRNGGGPACLRLRVPVDEAARAAIDPRFLLDERRWETLCALVERHWPESIDAAQLADPALWDAVGAAHDALDALLARI
ncbi:N-succinylarginine dihydrolase [Rhizorhabdus dicambivorans]|uniref:N-succinylarginine dihydrolase n=1 Tax=Rhizorhabdus dicambivorans TaxID=1850238 RepID=A0A2A4FZZ4_9SPHN|nr:N-succinylarginine dihydrolase [Rhizorhabdus dicambivorans]ATE65104.1 N-succinylarginine dihydrolase [Rhizorhabdus dicambivorans]PCE44377.1 N-succinylarginine dihydrolase [Rhizorhabdus dicambivorans]